MGWIFYFGLLSLFSALQVIGFVMMRMAFPDAPFDVVSGIFNIGILVLGPLAAFVHAFKKKFLSPTIWKGVFAFIVAGIVYALYFLLFVMRQRMPGYQIPWPALALYLIYIPLLIANYRLSREIVDR